MSPQEKALHSAVRRLVEEVEELADSDATVDALSRLIERLPFAAFVADSHGRFVAVNAAAAKLTGYTVAELKQLSVAQITPARNERESETLWRVFLQQQEQRGHYQVLRKDGRIVVADYAALTDILPGLHVSLIRER